MYLSIIHGHDFTLYYIHPLSKLQSALASLVASPLFPFVKNSISTPVP